MPFANRTVIGCTAEALRRGGVDRIILVSAPDDHELQQWAKRGGWELAVNPDASRGMLSSIQQGFEAAGRPATMLNLLVCPADLPLLRAETVARVLEASTLEDALLVAPVYQGKRGHPLAIAGERIRDIPNLDPDVGLRQLLLDHPEDLLLVDVDDPGAVRDLDTPGDYQLLKKLAVDGVTGR